MSCIKEIPSNIGHHMVMLSLTKEKKKRESNETSPVRMNDIPDHNCLLREPRYIESKRIKTQRSETSMGSHQPAFQALNMHMNGEENEFVIDEVKNAMPDIDPAYYKEDPNLINITEHNRPEMTQEMRENRQK